MESYTLFAGFISLGHHSLKDNFMLVTKKQTRALLADSHEITVQPKTESTMWVMNNDIISQAKTEVTSWTYHLIYHNTEMQYNNYRPALVLALG